MGGLVSRQRRPLGPRLFRFLAAAGILAQISAWPVLAAGNSQGYGEGGSLLAYLALVNQYNEHSEPFRIEGECKSACTLFLAIRNVCVERDAVLMFHAGRDVQANVTGPETRASRLMLSAYNAKLRAYLIAGHRLDTSTFFSIAGNELIDRFGYRECLPQ
jgi:hypothetical protein